METCNVSESTLEVVFYKRMKLSELLEAYEDGLGVDEPMSSLGGSLCPMRQTGGCQTRGDVSNPRHIQALSLVQRNVCVETKY